MTRCGLVRFKTGSVASENEAVCDPGDGEHDQIHDGGDDHKFDQSKKIPRAIEELPSDSAPPNDHRDSVPNGMNLRQNSGRTIQKLQAGSFGSEPFSLANECDKCLAQCDLKAAPGRHRSTARREDYSLPDHRLRGILHHFVEIQPK